MRRKAHTLSGQGASSSTVISESALVSANRTRTPSQTLKYVVSGEPGPALISPSPPYVPSFVSQLLKAVLATCALGTKDGSSFNCRQVPPVRALRCPRSYSP